MAGFIAQIFYLLNKDAREDGIIVLLVTVLLIVVIFIIFSLVIIFGTIIFRERIILKKSKTHFITIVVSYVLTALAGVSYLLGNRIGTVFFNYGEYLNCDNKCREIVDEMGNTLVILAILLLTLTPLLVNKINMLSIHVVKDTHSINEDKEPLWSPWKIIVQSLALILDLDAWFTAVSGIPIKVTIYCPFHEKCLEWSVFVISLIVWAMLVVVIGLPYINIAYKTKENRHKAVILCIILALIWVASGGYLLVDNTQPLGCTFGCYTDLPHLNINYTTIDCHYEAFHTTRATILFIILIFLTSMTITLVVHWCQKYGKTIINFRKGSNGSAILDQTPDDQEIDIVGNEADKEMDVVGNEDDKEMTAIGNETDNKEDIDFKELSEITT